MVEDQNAGGARYATVERRRGDDADRGGDVPGGLHILGVSRSQLAILEYAMKGCKREDIAIMARRRRKHGQRAVRPGTPSPRAESILKWRREGEAVHRCGGQEGGRSGGGTYRGHDEALAGAIASAWLALPDDRETGWPTFARDGEPLEPLAS